MNRIEFDLLNQAYNSSLGRAQVTKDIGLNHAIRSRRIYRDLQKMGYLMDDGSLTAQGLEALSPYKVDNAVILAAGSASRFIPLSLEQPKALYKVRGECLIERQIQQLLEAGIQDITIVLGYKKDTFQYLQDKYPVKFIYNPAYNVKNNIESLYLSKDKLNNTYICVCDSYFSENPFNAYEYDAFYAGYTTSCYADEMFAICDETGKIIDMEKGLTEGYVLLGHSFWTRDFSKQFIALAEKDRLIGNYDDKFWEWLVKDNLQDLPSLYFKEYEPDMIHEFDYFEQLREFDQHYLSYSHSEIIRNIKLVFRCDEEDIVDFRPVSEGMTNTSFIFKIKGIDYIYRHPGDGTENIINRRNEKKSLIRAKNFGIDPTYIYMDVNEGWKISKFVHHFREPDYRDFEDSKKVIRVMQRLHSIQESADYGMEPWEDAVAMEELLRKHDARVFEPYEDLKRKIESLYCKTSGDGVKKCFCHGDTYKPNWMIKDDGTVILIDWEYAGFSDPGIDVGYYIVDAMYDFPEAERFIETYLGASITPQRKYHFMAYVAIIAYYWFVWALYRESCGASMHNALQNWHDMAVKYADFLLK